MLGAEFTKRRRGVVGLYTSKEEDAFLKKLVEDLGGSVSQHVSRFVWEACQAAKSQKA